MIASHIVKSFNKDLSELQSLVHQMGGIAEDQLHNITIMLQKKDPKLAAQIVERDMKINTLQHMIDDESIRLIALRQPMAQDLRQIISAPRIAVELERIGDYCSNVAKRSSTIFKLPQALIPSLIIKMSLKAEEILKNILDGLAQENIDLALQGWEADSVLDEYHSIFTNEMINEMKQDSDKITLNTHLLFMAKNIERIADHATNIAEVAHFMILGHHLKKKRPKHDTSSQAIG